MIKTHQPDYIFVSSVFVLLTVGLIILLSASVVLSQDLFGETYYFLKHQVLYGLLPGLVGFLICQQIYYKRWQRLALPLLVVSIVLLLLVFIPSLSYGHGGAKRWIGLYGISFQPFEFAKLSFILYAAAILSKKENTSDSIKQSFIPVLSVYALISILVLLQPNMSAVIILSLILCIIYFLAEINLSYLAAFFGLALASFSVLIKMSPYRMQRLTVFLHPETDPQGIGYQINQALLAIGSGGLFGLGIGYSLQKWKYLPEVIGDSIFAIAAEEVGFIGASLIVIFFVILGWRGLMIAKKSPDILGRLLAGGITGWIFFQAFINMAVISGIIPLTGMPLPLISYGGSALAVTMAGAGVVVNISKHTK